MPDHIGVEENEKVEELATNEAVTSLMGLYHFVAIVMHFKDGVWVLKGIDFVDIQ